MLCLNNVSAQTAAIEMMPALLIATPDPSAAAATNSPPNAQSTSTTPHVLKELADGRPPNAPDPASQHGRSDRVRRVQDGGQMSSAEYIQNLHLAAIKADMEGMTEMARAFRQMIATEVRERRGK